MSFILDQFNKAKRQFDKDRIKDDGYIVMQKVIELINELGQHFSQFNGGELAEIQMKLAGYKFYLADYLADLQRISENLKLELKEIKAKRWDEISEEIKAEQGKVKNKDQVENVIVIESKEIANLQILYETMYYKYKLKISAIDDILTATVQQIAAKKRELEQSKSMQ